MTRAEAGVRSAVWLPVLAALAVRLVPVAVASRPVADVLRYQKLAEHVLDVSWNPYATRRLYPYPPVWLGFEVAAEWTSRHTGAPFPVLVKLPIVAADLLLVALLAGRGRRRGEGAWAAWTYALHPVALLITGFHGQFDSLAMLGVVAALDAHERGRQDHAALALGAAIAVKSFPVLLLPLFVLGPARAARPVRFAVLAAVPVALLLVPFALDDAAGVRRELLAYGGVADFGWIGLVRGVRWLATGALARSEAARWPLLVPVSKAVFLAAYAAFLAAYATARLRLSTPLAALAALLMFHVLYGAISAQYHLWVVAVAVLTPSLRFALHAGAALLGLVGFYVFLAPGVLLAAAPGGEALAVAGRVWVLGTALVLAVCLEWLVALLRSGRRQARPA